MKDQEQPTTKMIEFFGNGIIAAVILAGAHLTSLHFANVDFGEAPESFAIAPRIVIYFVAFAFTSVIGFTVFAGYKVFFMPMTKK